MKHPRMFDKVSIEELKEWVREFPYSQNLRMLLAKKIKLEGGMEDDASIIDAAMYATDRERMAEYLDDEKSLHENPSGQLTSGTGAANEEMGVEEPDLQSTHTHAEESVEVAEIQSGDFSGNGNEDMGHPETNLEDIVQTNIQEEGVTPEDEEISDEDLLPEQPEPAVDKESLADFTGDGHTNGRQPDAIEETRQSRWDEDQNTTALSAFSKWLLTLNQLSEKDAGPKLIMESSEPTGLAGKDLVSASLAELLADQGHFSEAIHMYEKLILKYPEKSAYFAAQIEKLKAT